MNIILDLLLNHLETAMAFKYLLFKNKKRERVVPLVLFRILDTDENRFKMMSRKSNNLYLRHKKNSYLVNAPFHFMRSHSMS